jgi:hypothetical protein
MAPSKIKIYLERTKISGHLRHSENLAATLKVIPKEELHECSSSGSILRQNL